MNFRKTFKQAMVAILSFAIAGGPALAARTTTYFHTDAAGSVVAMTNEAGQVLGRKDYSPFGEQINSPPDAERTSYTGKQHDDVVGLTYFGARWFDPEIGRFTSVDPVSFVDEQTMSFNRYAYGNNNPYKYVDPDGRVGVAIWFLAALAVIGPVASNYANTPVPGEIPRKGGATQFAGEAILSLSPFGRQAFGRVPVVTKGPVDYSRVKNPPNVWPGKDFTKRQKEEFVRLNRETNGGVVKSDKSGTTLSKPPKSKRGETPDENEWQIDHKTPKNCGGTNCSSNAQILSRKENRGKSDK